MAKMTEEQWVEQLSKYKSRMAVLTGEYDKKTDERDLISKRLQELKTALHELKMQIKETREILDLLESVGFVLEQTHRKDAPDLDPVTKPVCRVNYPEPQYKLGCAMQVALHALRRLGGEQGVIDVLVAAGGTNNRKTQTKYRNALAKLCLDGWVVRVGSGRYRTLDPDKEVLEGHEVEDDPRTVVKKYESVRFAIIRILDSDATRTWTIPEVARENGVTDTSDEELMREYRSAFSYQHKKMKRIKRIDTGVYASLKYRG